MDAQPYLQSFVEKNRLKYSGCMRYRKADKSQFISMSYSLSMEDYNKLCITLGTLRSSLQKISIPDLVFVDVTAGFIVTNTNDLSPMNDMYRIQILYKIFSF